MELYEQLAGRAGADCRRRRQEGASVQGQVRVPAGIDDERVPQPAQAVQHDEGRRQPRLQRLRRRNAHRFSTQVRPYVCPSPNVFTGHSHVVETL